MDSLAFIDLYCERTAPGFWNEPVNALSNAAFPLAALIVWRMARTRPEGPPDLVETVLIVLAGLIGVGSFLFHTFANTQAELADVIPIWSFVALYVLAAIYRATGEDRARTARIALIALGITGAIFWSTSGDVVTDGQGAGGAGADPFNGSLQYLPALAALAGFSLATALRRHPARGLVLGATAVFGLSLLFRTIDLRSCALTGLGTHFLWHLLNAAMVGLLLVVLVRHFPPAGRARRA